MDSLPIVSDMRVGKIMGGIVERDEVEGEKMGGQRGELGEGGWKKDEEDRNRSIERVGTIWKR